MVPGADAVFHFVPFCLHRIVLVISRAVNFDDQNRLAAEAVVNQKVCMGMSIHDELALSVCIQSGQIPEYHAEGINANLKVYHF